MDTYVIPHTCTAEDIRYKRRELGLTQREFAQLVGVSKPTVERWEASKQVVTGPIAALLDQLTPEYLEQRRVPEKQKPLRMWYMYKNKPCTLIDVDEGKRQISIRNYTDMLQFRAFGCKEQPTYKDYQEFLEERCFARSRDKLKLILEDLDLPFYDPYLIIQKTGGYMAEDDFHIVIER